MMDTTYKEEVTLKALSLNIWTHFGQFNTMANFPAMLLQDMQWKKKQNKYLYIK